MVRNGFPPLKCNSVFLLACGCSQDAGKLGGVCVVHVLVSYPKAHLEQHTAPSKWSQPAKSTRDLVLLKNRDSVKFILPLLSCNMFIHLGCYKCMFLSL